MKLYDVNATHQLALVKNDEGNSEYVPLNTVGDLPIEDLAAAYRKQLHYVCRAHAQGLVISHVDPMLDGWLLGNTFEYGEYHKRDVYNAGLKTSA
jgi:hypothetical protein